MSELDERIAAEDTKINAITKERLLVAQRIFQDEIRWIEIRAAEDKFIARAQFLNSVFWGVLIGLLTYSVTWAIFAAF